MFNIYEPSFDPEWNDPIYFKVQVAYDQCPTHYTYGPVAYPGLVSRGVSKNLKCKWLVKVDASNSVTPLNKKNHGRGGGFPGNQKTPLDTPLRLPEVITMVAWTNHSCAFARYCVDYITFSFQLSHQAHSRTTYSK